MKQHFPLIGLFIVIIGLLIAGSIMGFSSSYFLNPKEASTVEKNLVKINDLQVRVDFARDQESQSKGLGGKDSLSEDQGMLFVFEKESKYTFWMKDVKFPIDIIWISKDKKVVDFYKNAEAQLGVPDNELKVYSPESPALYVLEVNAGLSEKYNIHLGDEVKFDI